MLNMRPSMSICTPLAWPGWGMYSVYGMLEPTMRSVSHPIIRSQEGSRPFRSQHAAVDVYLHAPRLARLGHVLGVRHARADHEERVAPHHKVPGRLAADRADPAGHERQIVRHRRHTQEGLGHAAPAEGGRAVPPARR